MSTQNDPYCCISADGHIWHHCIHRQLEEAIANIKSIQVSEVSRVAIESILLGESVEEYNKRKEDRG